MTQQPGNSYAALTADPDTGHLSDAERYPDPRRDWKRTGSLLGGWVVTWAAVFVLGIVWNFWFAPALETNPATDQVSARTSVRLFFTAVYEDLDADTAKSKVCGEYDGPDPAALVQELDGGFYDPDVNIEGNASPMTVQVRLFDGGPFTNREYTVQATEDGTSSCITKIEY